uniref:Uncharacterized protein n=1 Tax=Arundo donax TaxID=35708 RepID=A0A0A9BGJ7_ARUDO
MQQITVTFYQMQQLKCNSTSP